MAAPTILTIDDTGVSLDSWQLLKSQSIAQTALTADQLSQNMRDVNYAQTTWEFIDVSRFTAIRLQIWGVADNDHAPVIDLYGWSATGPGNHIGKVTLAYGNFTSAASTGFHAAAQTHISIRNAFAAATPYRGCDTYTVTADYEQDAILDILSPAEVDFPGFLNVDFSGSHYKYFCVAVTTLAGTTLGAIFKPLLMKERL